MTPELVFVGGSFVVGVAQMAEAWFLIRDRGRLSAAVAATSTVEFAWAVFCAYLLVTGRLEFARWLAITFLVYMVGGAIIAGAIGYHMGRHSPPTTTELDPFPIRYAWVGGVFGAAFAAAALFLLAA